MLHAEAIIILNFAVTIVEKDKDIQRGEIIIYDSHSGSDKTECLTLCVFVDFLKKFMKMNARVLLVCNHMHFYIIYIYLPLHIL